MKYTGARDAFGTALCEELGLDPTRVFSIELIVKPGEIVHVDIGLYLEREQGEAIQAVMRRYKLHPELIEQELIEARDVDTRSA